MRVYFRSTKLPMRFAQAIRTVFPALKLLTAQEWAAQTFGYRDWHDLSRESQNFRGQPTDVWREAALPTDYVSPDGRRTRRRDAYDNFQIQVFERLAAGTISSLWNTGLYQEIYRLAKGGEESPRIADFGKGTPLFNSIQKAWFRSEELGNNPRLTGEGQFWLPKGASADFKVEEHEEYSLGEHAVVCGFADEKQANRYFGNSTGQPEEVLRLLRRSLGSEEVNKLLPVHAGASEAAAYADSLGRVVMTQSSKYRYWVKSPKNKMLGGFNLVISLRARQDSPIVDRLRLHVHSAWELATPEAEAACSLLYAGPQDEVEDTLIQFCATLVGAPEHAGRIEVVHDERELSREIAEGILDVLPEWLAQAGFAPCNHLIDKQLRPFVQDTRDSQ
jgi:hypothetical protein